MKVSIEKVTDNYGSISYWAGACGEIGYGFSEADAIKDLEKVLNKRITRITYRVDADLNVDLKATRLPWYSRLLNSFIG